MLKRLRIGSGAVTTLLVGVVLVLAAGAVSQLPAIGAGALLFPSRRVNTAVTPSTCADRQFVSGEVVLDGWVCSPRDRAGRGTVIYLHGVSDNRGSAVGAIGRLVGLGYTVIAYDSRAHGTSGGDRCTYGYFEKRDVQAVIDQAGASHVVLIGHSLGGAVALQAAAVEPRIRAVVAASSFSDLRTIATERVSPLPSWTLGPAFARAERDGQFVVDNVSPVNAAARLAIPVLLVHGAQDGETPPIHSQRVYDALSGAKKLIVVPGAGHNDVFRSDVWRQIEEWIAPYFFREIGGTMPLARYEVTSLP